MLKSEGSTAQLERGPKIMKHQINESAKSEAECRQAENKLRTIFESVSEGIAITNLEGNIIQVNDIVLHMHGYESQDELIGRHGSILMAGKERDRLDKIFKRVIEVGDSHDVELTLVRKDGSEFPGEINFALLRDNSGTPMGFVTLAKDITDRKLAQMALVESEAKYSTLVERGNDGIIIIQDTLMKFVNAAMSAMTGYSVKEATGKSFIDFVSPEYRDFVVERYKRRLAGDDVPSRYEIEIVAKNGAKIPVEISASVIEYQGKPANMAIVRDITERKESEFQLRESEDRYHNIFESTYDLIQSAALDGRLLFVNRAWREALGYTEAEIPNLNLFGIIHPDSISHCREMFSKVMAGEPVRDIQTIFVAKDGHPVILEGSAVPRFIGKKVVATHGFFHDVTERKQAEELFKNLAGSSPVGIYIVQKGKFRYVNPQFQKYSGYDEEELLKMNALDIVVPEDREIVRENAIRMLKGESTDSYEYRSVNKEGSTRWILETVAPIHYHGQRATIGNYMDITERKQAEAKIEQAAEEWKSTFDSIADAVSIHDKDYRILRVNKAFAAMFRMEPEQLIGRHCYEVMHGTDCPWDNCPHRQALATRKPATAELYEPHLARYFQYTTSPILNEQGEVVATVHIARDVTERKHQEEQLIMTDRLASVGELVAGIAHELNNPLTSVIGFSELLKENNIPDEAKEDLDIISREAGRAAGIVKNLLTFARKHETTKQPSQVNKIIEEVLKLRAYEHKVSNITVHRRMARTLPEIPVDYFQIQQVLLNIIVNAEMAMLDAHNKGTLTITTKRVNGTVRITIADDGPGISKENLDKIFNPFFTTKEVGKGTGLGLSICHGIVTAHGGNIYARSKPGSGATFTVELPANGNQPRQGN